MSVLLLLLICSPGDGAGAISCKDGELGDRALGFQVAQEEAVEDQLGAAELHVRPDAALQGVRDLGHE